MSQNESQIDSAILRPEGRPLDWSRLFTSQQEAFAQLLAFLVAATNHLDGAPKRDEGDSGTSGIWLDMHRESRVAFLSGARGSGKTTVLLSLMRHHLEAREGVADLGGLPHALRTSLHDLSRRIVWLEPIDMDPMPADTNLLAAILARIDAQIGETSPTRRHRDPGSEYDSWGATGSVQDVTLDFLRLQADVALAWDGNLASRAQHLDPDIYASEVLRAEAARLSLNKNLGRLLDRLSTEFYYTGHVRSPMFVLPVDDFDLSPSRCLDLLRLLRMISVPRLFTVILGNIRVALSLFGVQTHGEITRVAQSSSITAAERIDGRNLHLMIDDIARNAMDKLVPGPQRIRLVDLSPNETLKFSRDPRLPSIGALFAKHPIDPPGPAIEHELLTDSSMWPKDLAELVSEGSNVRTSRSAFRLRPRLVQDLWQDMRDRFRSPDGVHERVRLVSYLGEFARRAIIADPGLGFSAKEQLINRGLVRAEDLSCWLDSRYFIMRPELSPRASSTSRRSSDDETYEPLTPTLRANPEPGDSAYWLEMRPCYGWQLLARVEPPPQPLSLVRGSGSAVVAELTSSDGRVGRPELGAQASGAVALFNDLTAQEPRLARNLVSGPLSLSQDGRLLASAVWADRFRFGWPLPAWSRTWQFDLFADSWMELFRTSPPGESIRIERVAFRWILSSAVITCGRAANSILREDSWSELAQFWGSLEASGHAGVLSFSRVLTQLLSPELGLPVWIAEKFFREPSLAEVWRTHALRVRQLRESAIRECMLEAGDERGLTELAAARWRSQEHPMNRFNGGQLEPDLDRALAMPSPSK